MLNRLPVFDAVYHSGNTGRAAEQLNVSRSAISQSISRLEAELGVCLFTRQPRGLVPTRAAHQLAESIGPLLAQLDDELNAVRGQQTRPRGTLHIGAPPVTGTFHLPRIIEAFNRELPEVEFRLTFGYSIDLISQVLSGALDMSVIDVFGGVHLQREFHAFCHREPLLAETVVLACSPDYYARQLGDDLSYDNLARQHFLSVREDFLEVRSWFQHQYQQVPAQLRRTLFSENGLAVLDCACRGLGLFIVGTNVAQRYIDDGRLVAVAPVDRGETNQLSLIQLLDRKPSRVEKAFIRHLRHYAANDWLQALTPEP